MEWGKSRFDRRCIVGDGGSQGVRQRRSWKCSQLPFPFPPHMTCFSKRHCSSTSPKKILAASIAVLSVVTTSPAAESIFSNAFVGTGDHDSDIGLSTSKVYFATANFA